MTENKSSKDVRKAAFFRAGIGLPIVALLIILPSGTWNYWQGWLYIAVLYTPLIFTMAYLFKNDPALLERRMRTKEKETAQRRIIGIAIIYFLVAFMLPGFDRALNSNCVGNFKLACFKVVPAWIQFWKQLGATGVIR